MAAAGRGSSDPTPVRGDAPADLGAAGADRLTGRPLPKAVQRREGITRQKCPRKIEEAGHLASIHVGATGLMMRDRSDKDFRVAGLLATVAVFLRVSALSPKHERPPDIGQQLPRRSNRRHRFRAQPWPLRQQDSCGFRPESLRLQETAGLGGTVDAIEVTSSRSGRFVKGSIQGPDVHLTAAQVGGPHHISPNEIASYPLRYSYRTDDGDSRRIVYVVVQFTDGAGHGATDTGYWTAR
jgi:hypothetical protein